MGRVDHFLFFVEDISSNVVVLDESETRHATAVVRLHAGDTVQVTDGKGGRASCLLDAIVNGKGHLTVIDRTVVTRKPPVVALGIGLPERDAFEEILTNITALGIAHIIPIPMHFCQKRWWNTDWDKIARRFHQIMVTALKQSHGLFLPRLTPPCSLEDALTGDREIFRIVADPEGCGLNSILPRAGIPESMICFVGPPGGFCEDELRLFEHHSVPLVKLAPFRLRTELAATVVCAQITGCML